MCRGDPFGSTHLKRRLSGRPITVRDPWITRAELPAELRIARDSRGDHSAEASSMQMYREAVNAESPRRGGLSQAPPRYSISTKTLRMVHPPYGDPCRPVSR